MSTRRHPLLATLMFAGGALLMVVAALSPDPLNSYLLFAGAVSVFAALVVLVVWRTV